MSNIFTSYCNITQPPALTVVLAVDDVERSIWSASILQHLSQQHGACGHTLRGLQQVRVATYHAHREHPQGDHGREVEGGNAGTHPKGKAIGVSVHVFGDGGQGFPEHQGGDAAGVFYHLCTERSMNQVWSGLAIKG